jgi:hypothetical protein
MLHSAIHWPGIADASLWPMVVAHAYVTAFPVQKQNCPHMIWSRKHDGNRSSSMTYMSGAVHFTSWKRQSPTARSYLNPDSGAITEQFHDVSDDWFATVSPVADTQPDFHSRVSDLSFCKTQYTTIRSTTTISRMPSISRFRLHRTMPIALPVQWISFNHRYSSTVLHHRLHRHHSCLLMLVLLMLPILFRCLLRESR